MSKNSTTESLKHLKTHLLDLVYFYFVIIFKGKLNKLYFFRFYCFIFFSIFQFFCSKSSVWFLLFYFKEEKLENTTNSNEISSRTEFSKWLILAAASFATKDVGFWRLKQRHGTYVPLIADTNTNATLRLHLLESTPRISYQISTKFTP